MAAPAQQQLGVLVDDRSEDVDQTPAAHEAHGRTVSAVALTKTEAARALGMSVRSLDKYVMSEIKVIRRGSIVLIPVRELERWAESSAEATL